MAMSDKYLEYGLGKDIDPEELRFKMEHEFPGSPYHEVWIHTLLDALQQREERRLEALKIASERYDSIGTDWAEREILSQIIDILESKQ